MGLEELVMVMAYHNCSNIQADMAEGVNFFFIMAFDGTRKSRYTRTLQIQTYKIHINLMIYCKVRGEMKMIPASR